MGSPFPAPATIAVGPSIAPLSSGLAVGPGDPFAGLSLAPQTAYLPNPQTPFQASLLMASYKGIPFGVLDNRGEVGRRGELHEYPGRDIPYAEDLGRRGRKVSLRGFVIGDDCAAQRDQLLAAIEQKGPGQLVHPSMGVLMLQPDPRRPSLYTERWDHGRVVELELYFVEPGKFTYPSAAGDTQANSQAAADGIDGAGAVDLQNGASAVSRGTSNLAQVTTFQQASDQLDQLSAQGAGVLSAPTTSDASSPNVVDDLGIEPL